jgi:hypothetical protein
MSGAEFTNTGNHFAPRHVTRRGFFERMADGICGVALTSLLSKDLFGATTLPIAEGDLPAGHRPFYDLKPRPPHFEPKARRVIQLFMNGGPSQMDLFDPKPMLDKHNGEAYFDKVASEVTTTSQAGGLMRSPFQFSQHGKSGMWFSELMPHLAGQADELCMIRSMQTLHSNHEPALFVIHSGRTLPGRATVGAWTIFGLGTENQNLPAYVVLDDPLGLPINGVQNWQAGFLPPIYQGTRIRTLGSPILNLQPDTPEPDALVQAGRTLLSRLDDIHKREHYGQMELDARIASYELAARLQLSANDALDISKESEATRAMYGIGQQPTDSYGRRCLMARRLVERGVRYVQLYINAQIWDNHFHLEADIRSACARTDQPVAALLQDLKQRGLLNDTLVLWGGEFGRMPIAQLQGDPSEAGRDHNPKAFTLWMAGGGVKPGITYGTTDEFGFSAAENPVSVADWHATVLHQLGMDYQRLAWEEDGLKEKLTSQYQCRVVKEILA